MKSYINYFLGEDYSKSDLLWFIGYQAISISAVVCLAIMVYGGN